MSAIEQLPNQQVPTAEPVAVEATRSAGGAAVALAGGVTVLEAAWAGVAPYVGPVFGWDPTTHTSWHWALAPGLLALVPGAVGVVAGLSMLSSSARLRLGIGRLSLVAAGALAVLAGGWLVVGPSAWPALHHGASYLLPGSATRLLTANVGLSYGPGVLLAVLGAFTAGWAFRHRPAARLHQRGVVHPLPRTLAPVAPVAPVAPAGTTPAAARTGSPTAAGPMASGPAVDGIE